LNNEVVINISNLIEDKVKRIDFEYLFKCNEIPFKDKSITFCDNFFLAGKIKKFKENFLFTGKIKTKLKLQCNTCLTDFVYVLNANILLNYVRKDETNADEDYINEKEYYNSFEGFFINITEDIRQWILLNIPFYPKCKDDCLGLCQSCGTNLNEQKCDCDSRNNQNDYGIFNNIINKLNIN
jgi:uncharacterized protein